MTTNWRSSLVLIGVTVLTLHACSDVPAPTAPPSLATFGHCDRDVPCATGTPRARGYPLMVHDPVEDLLYMVGGYHEFGFESEIFDVWVFDPRSSTWRQVADELPPKNGDQIALDVQSRKIIMFQPYDDPIETWAFDLETGAWENRLPAVQPPPRWGAKMVYDRESDRVILYGGAHLSTGRLIGDTWAYDFETNTWTELTPATSPPPFHFVDMIYVPTIDRVLLFGGIAGDAWDSGILHNGTWAYDYNANEWTNLAPEHPPAPRVYHTLAFEAKTNRVVMFGGVLNESEWPQEPTIDETWIYDVAQNAWSRVDPRRSPSARAWHAMAGTNRTVVLFGGGDSRWTYTNDTFLYKARSNRWRKVSERGNDDD